MGPRRLTVHQVARRGASQPRGLTEWLRLAALVDEMGAVPDRRLSVARGIDAGAGRMTAAELPDWLLRPPHGGFFPDDPGRQHVRWVEVHARRDARRVWLAEHAPHLAFRKLDAERRRFPAVEK